MLKTIHDEQNDCEIMISESERESHIDSTSDRGKIKGKKAVKNKMSHPQKISVNKANQKKVLRSSSTTKALPVSNKIHTKRDSKKRKSTPQREKSRFKKSYAKR